MLDPRTPESERNTTLEFEGLVLGPEGAAHAGAVVVSSAGGQAVADASGWYRLEVRVPLLAEHIRITAVGRSGRSLIASASVGLSSGARIRVAPLRLAQGTTCSPAWLPTFGAQPGVAGSLRAVAVFDDGAGPALYMAGDFESAGNALASCIARWDGSHWASLGSGLNDEARALAVYDDGSGPALYVAGLFTEAGGVVVNHVARWDGTSWSALDVGTNNDAYCLEVYDDGSGPDLIVGGAFTAAGTGAVKKRIARWDASGWARLGSGMDGAVESLAVHDEGAGPRLFAGGTFTTAGGGYAARIARWNGAAWSSVGTGLGSSARALTVYDDGNGARLIAGGAFTTAGGAAANRVAAWNGTAWMPLGSGRDASVDSLAVYDDGSGPALFAGGSSTGPGPAKGIARWNGTSWEALASGVNSSVTAMAVYDDGNGPALYPVGYFTTADGLPSLRIARWNGVWSSLDRGFNGEVRALASFDDGSGPALFVGGSFDGVDGMVASGIARWDGTSWSPLGGGLKGNAYALTVHDDGSGPALFAGGDFTLAGGTVANNIARWDGAGWSQVGSSGISGEVYSLASYDDGNGPALYAGGRILEASGAAAVGIARWDGTAWSGIGDLLDLQVPTGGIANALAAFVDGGGPALYVGGEFTDAGPVSADFLARHDASGWSEPGGGANSVVQALVVHDDGSGPALYVGGEFTSVDGTPASFVARWDGTSWAPLGSGMNQRVYALASYDDGSGLALYAGGLFTIAGAGATRGIARWDGTSWAPLGSGLDGTFATVYALAPYDDGNGSALYAGGSFPRMADSGDSSLARWGCDTTPPVISCPTAVIVTEPLGPPSGTVVHFAVSASDAVDPAPIVTCVPAPGSFFPTGATPVICTATDSSGNQSQCQFEVTVLRKTRRP